MYFLLLLFVIKFDGCLKFIVIDFARVLDWIYLNEIRQNELKLNNFVLFYVVS